MNRSGITPSKRKIGEHSNQWTASPKQMLFMQAYLDPQSPTFSNAYRSAIQAGYSKAYANDILFRSSQWLQDYAGKSSITMEHIEEALIQLASFSRETDSKSPDDTRIKALELLAKLKGMLIERKQVAQVIKVELGDINAPIDQ